MTVKYKTAVQNVQHQYVEFDFGDVPTGVFLPLFTLPQGAIVINGFSLVKTVAGSTTNVLDYGTAGAPTALLNDDDAKALGFTPFTAQAEYPAGAVIGVTQASTGAVIAAGKFGAGISYIMPGTSDGIYG